MSPLGAGAGAGAVAEAVAEAEAEARKEEQGVEGKEEVDEIECYRGCGCGREEPVCPVIEAGQEAGAGLGCSVAREFFLSQAGIEQVFASTAPLGRSHSHSHSHSHSQNRSHSHDQNSSYSYSYQSEGQSVGQSLNQSNSQIADGTTVLDQSQSQSQSQILALSLGLSEDQSHQSQLSGNLSDHGSIASSSSGSSATTSGEAVGDVSGDVDSDSNNSSLPDVGLDQAMIQVSSDSDSYSNSHSLGDSRGNLDDRSHALSSSVLESAPVPSNQALASAQAQAQTQTQPRPQEQGRRPGLCSRQRRLAKLVLSVRRPLFWVGSLAPAPAVDRNDVKGKNASIGFGISCSSLGDVPMRARGHVLLAQLALKECLGLGSGTGSGSGAGALIGDKRIVATRQVDAKMLVVNVNVLR